MLITDSRNNSLINYQFVFCDESGDYEFHAKASKYLIFTAVVISEPHLLMFDFEKLRLEQFVGSKKRIFTHFHAYANNEHTRKKFYHFISHKASALKAFSLYLEKSKAHPKVRDFEVLYPQFYSYLFKNVFEIIDPNSCYLIFDKLPQRGSNKINKFKSYFGNRCGVLAERVQFHSDITFMGLQIADYVSYAIHHVLEKNNNLYYNMMGANVLNKKPIDIFEKGTHHYY